MATYALALGGSTKISALALNHHFCAQVHLDFAKIIADDATLAAADQITSGDILQIWTLPPRYVVQGVILEIQTAAGATCTVDVGLTGVSAAGWFNDASLATADILMSTYNAAYGPGTVTGKDVAAADTIDLLFNNDMTTANAAEMNVFIYGIALPPYIATPALEQE